jgi:hypothetical protein
LDDVAGGWSRSFDRMHPTSERSPWRPTSNTRATFEDATVKLRLAQARWRSFFVAASAGGADARVARLDILARVPELGDPTSYLELETGVPVYSSDGERVGVVEHVLADADADIFDGLIVDAGPGPGGHRFADATLVDALYERGAVLAIGAAACGRLPEPSASPAVIEADPDDTAPDDLGDKLRRAWNVISGNY